MAASDEHRLFFARLLATLGCGLAAHWRRPPESKEPVRYKLLARSDQPISLTLPHGDQQTIHHLERHAIGKRQREISEAGTEKALPEARFPASARGDGNRKDSAGGAHEDGLSGK